MGDEVSAELVESLKATAQEVRRDVIRWAYATGSGSPGGSLSIADLLTALIFRELRLQPEHPDWPDRDRLLLSKGHAAAALESALYLRGFRPREEVFAPRETEVASPRGTARGSPATSSGSVGGLGVGLGVAVGVALDARWDRRPSRVCAILGDGEFQNGGTWEALLAAAHYSLGNLVVLVDRNEFEADGPTEALLAIEPLVDKLRAFRCRTVEIDGHDFPEILTALATARHTSDAPTVIVAHTVSGKGVSFMENTHVWHSRVPSKDEADRALIELGAPPAEALR